MNLQCPDCDWVVPPVAVNKKKGTAKYKPGIFDCPECNTRLIVRVSTTGVATVDTKPAPKAFYPGYKAPVDPTGVRLDWEGDWKPSPVEPSAPVFVGCVNCGEELQSTIGSVRARIMKGLMKMEREGSHIDPTTGKPVVVVSMVPMYESGRLGKCCLGKLTACRTGSNPKRGEFEYLHERIALRKREVVTAGMVKMDDLQEKLEREKPKFIDLGDIRVKAPEEMEEQVDVTAYRAFYKMNGRKKYKGSYDADSNATNATVKRG